MQKGIDGWTWTKEDARGNEGRCEEFCFGDKQAGGHSSGTMSSTAGQKEPTGTNDSPSTKRKGKYKDRGRKEADES
ncbi:hypothetical protein N7540_006111 [Penicillium herquei]|nr:hypothetical protein N7540_006111 [Penicillium herquei]